MSRSESIFPKLVTGSLMILMSLGFNRSESGFDNFEFELGYLKNNKPELDPSSYKRKSQVILSFDYGMGMGEGAAVV